MTQWCHSLWWKPSALLGLMGPRWFSVLIVLTYLAISIYRGGGNPFRTKAGRERFYPYLDTQAIPLPAGLGSEIPVWSLLGSHAPSSGLQDTQDHSNQLHKEQNLSQDDGLQDKASKAHVQDYIWGNLTLSHFSSRSPLFPNFDSVRS